MWGLILGGLLVAESAIAQASRYRQEGLALRQAERFNEAIEVLQQAVQLDPNNSTGWVLLGWTQHLAGQGEQAAQSLWTAIDRQPQQVEAYNALGIVYLVRGELSTAIALHSWASILQANNEIAYYNLSLAYQRQNLPDLAIMYAQTACQLEPHNPHPFLALALAYDTAQQREKAVVALRQGLALNPSYGDRAYVSNLQRAGFSDHQIRQISSMLD